MRARQRADRRVLRRRVMPDVMNSSKPPWPSGMPSAAYVAPDQLARGIDHPLRARAPTKARPRSRARASLIACSRRCRPPSCGVSRGRQCNAEIVSGTVRDDAPSPMPRRTRRSGPELHIATVADHGASRFASSPALLLPLAAPVLAVSWRAWREPASVRVRRARRGRGRAADVARARRARCCRRCGCSRSRCSIVALARPQRGEAASRTQGEGIDIVLAFDISSSMTQPFARGKTRLQAAQDVLSQFVDGAHERPRRPRRVPGREPDAQPADDRLRRARADGAGRRPHPARRRHGDRRSPSAQSVNVLRGSSAASRIVILLTDGENNAHDIEPLRRRAHRRAARRARLHRRRRQPRRSSPTALDAQRR